MPTLDNPRDEFFAQARAKGARLHGVEVDVRRLDQADIVDEFGLHTKAAAVRTVE